VSARPWRLTFVGHATVLIELDGVRLLTDPVLRGRVGPLRRLAAPVDPAAHDGLDAVLVSHLHHDHLDGPSLRRAGRRTPVIVPRGARPIVRGKRMRTVVELSPGESVALGAVQVVATPAEHASGRIPGGRRAPPLGYVVEGSRRIYFAGDTDRFDGMRAIGDRGLDVALLPVAGWGGRLPAGHLNPETAADALALLHPAVAIPIHWGTLAPAWWRRRSPRILRAPAEAFAAAAAARAPDVRVCLLDPGTSTPIAP
jgi:L-ascorbate metabolism protein UlaG (beta-lactamase superfamily)